MSGTNAVKDAAAAHDVASPLLGQGSFKLLSLRLKMTYNVPLLSIMTPFSTSSERIDPIREDALHDFLAELPKALNISRPGQAQYEEDIQHWAVSSDYEGVATYQPESVEDIASFFKALNSAGVRIPFGVKSGGHTANPGFSSSPGILVCMKRFNQVVYHPKTKTAVVGAGQIWDDVYEKLAEHNVSVLGARVTHIGVGYSWQTNQYGLAIDTVVAYELVKPDGTIVNVTEASDPDLFFALKGGGNNFGIVTNFTMKTFPQGDVWGGPIFLVSAGDKPEAEKKMKNLFNAVQTFIQKVTDPKATILVSLCTVNGPTKVLNLMAFYDGPSPPPGVFDIFKEIEPQQTSANWKTRTYLNLVQTAISYEHSKNYRGTFHTVGLAGYPPELLQAIWDENEHWGQNLPSETTSRYLISYSVEPFLSNILSHGSASAYPPDRSVAFSPFPIYVSWTDAKYDAQMQEFAKETTKRIQQAAERVGVQTGPKYPNYAIGGTPLEEMYGKNVEILKKTKARIDPKNIMGLAGGIKI